MVAGWGYCCAASKIESYYISVGRTKSNIKTHPTCLFMSTSNFLYRFFGANFCPPSAPHVAPSDPTRHHNHDYQVCTEIMMKGFRCMKSELSWEKVRVLWTRKRTHKQTRAAAAQTTSRERSPSKLVFRCRYSALFGNTYPKNI